jgi:hypothetical protein
MKRVVSDEWRVASKAKRGAHNPSCSRHSPRTTRHFFSDLWWWILNRFPLWHLLAGGALLFGAG